MLFRSNFWQHDHPYDIPAKCLEIYHWRDGVCQDAQGKLSMDEALVKSQVDMTRASPEQSRLVLERMLRDAAPVRRYLMTALGPGFTGAFLTLDRGS